MNENREACPYCGRYTCEGCESAGDTGSGEGVTHHYSQEETEAMAAQFKSPSDVGPHKIPDPGLVGVVSSIPKLAYPKYNKSSEFLKNVYGKLTVGDLTPAANMTIHPPGKSEEILLTGVYKRDVECALVYLISETGIEAIISVDLSVIQRITPDFDSLQGSIKEAVKHLGFAISTGKYRHVVDYPDYTG